MENIKILVLNEKHGNQFIKWSDDKVKQEEICRKILLDRKEQGWFLQEEQTDVQEALDNNKCFIFMRKRKNYEYEGFSIENLQEL